MANSLNRSLLNWATLRFMMATALYICISLELVYANVQLKLISGFTLSHILRWWWWSCWWCRISHFTHNNNQNGVVINGGYDDDCQSICCIMSLFFHSPPPSDPLTIAILFSTKRQGRFMIGKKYEIKLIKLNTRGKRKWKKVELCNKILLLYISPLKIIFRYL